MAELLAAAVRRAMELCRTVATLATAAAIVVTAAVAMGVVGGGGSRDGNAGGRGDGGGRDRDTAGRDSRGNGGRDRDGRGNGGNDGRGRDSSHASGRGGRSGSSRDHDRHGGGRYDGHGGGHDRGHYASHHYHDYHHRHRDWYHGSWHGWWAGPAVYRPYGWYWGGGWGVGWGFNVGSVSVGVSYGSPWAWGYYDYWNPYWVPPVRSVTYINYAQPIVVAPAPVVVNSAPAAQTTFAPTSGTTPLAVEDQAPTLAEVDEQQSSTQDQALDMLDTARSLFKRGDYPMALSQADRAIALLPNDPLMHEFRALCLFAMKDYTQAAAATYAVLSVGPGWDRSTVEGLYNNMAVYQVQLNALEAYRDANPNAGDAHFLLAYHYMLNDRNEQAAAELKEAVKLEPKNRLAAQLLKGLSAPVEDEQGPVLAAPTPAAAPVDAATLPGKWTAERSDGAKINLSLSADHKFSWTVADENNPQKLSGTYTCADNYLILTAEGQSALVGQVAMPSADQLSFKLAGGSPSDPGLQFTR